MGLYIRPFWCCSLSYYLFLPLSVLFWIFCDLSKGFQVHPKAFVKSVGNSTMRLKKNFMFRKYWRVGLGLLHVHKSLLLGGRNTWAQGTFPDVLNVTRSCISLKIGFVLPAKNYCPKNFKILQKNQNMKTTNCRDTKPLAMALLTFSHVMTFKVKGQGHSEM